MLPNDLQFDWIDGLSDDSLRRLLKAHLKMAEPVGEVVFSAGLGRQGLKNPSFSTSLKPTSFYKA